MKWRVYVLLCCAIMLFILSCKDGIVEPVISPPGIEDSTTYNEAYRDSIVALVWDAIVIMYKDGTGLRRLADIEGAISATWSPKKWKIVYSTSYEICVMNSDGTNHRTISRRLGRTNYAICSPNGKQIAYVEQDTTDLTGGWIRVMNTDGSSDVRITALQPTLHRISWTPDSKSVVFNGEDSVYTGIFIISANGKGLRSLYYGTLTLAPSLSPDGSLLAFSPFIGMTNKIWTMDMASRELRALTTGSSNDAGVSWSPDGSALVYGRSDSIAPYQWIGPSIWTINRDGTNNLPITRISQGVYAPCWQN